jgi:hypothetical protein
MFVYTANNKINQKSVHYFTTLSFRTDGQTLLVNMRLIFELHTHTRTRTHARTHHTYTTHTHTQPHTHTHTIRTDKNKSWWKFTT